ncbi:MAG: alpha/beta hydrolase [Candidatus Lokiarchaeota archaeon]|nr:alpha/beta hydrolase [Candidatus Lokiarchaeota archaeon]
MVIPTYYSAFEEVPEEFKTMLFERAVPYYKKHDFPSNTIVLCLHGFTAVPYEVKVIANAIYEKGIDIAAPLLPFHGYKNIEDQKRYFNRMREDIMMDAVKLEISKARQHYKNVFMYGQSMGGCIALCMAGLGLVDAVAATAPAIRIHPFSRVLATVMAPFSINQPKKEPRKFDSPGYDFNNARAAYELIKLSKFAQKNLENITIPVFIAHSHNDPTINGPITVKWMQQKIKGKFTVKWYDHCEHVIPLDVQKDEASADIANFFSNLR